MAPGERSKAVARVSILPGDILQPIRGGAVRIVENMEASLQVPTATSARTIPVRTLEENRRLLNKHREAAGQGKVSFTHLVAWAILRAFDTFPRMNDAYAEVDGQPHRIQRDQVRLGIAVDVQKKDGSRTLLVPNIKDAQKLELRRVPEGLRRARGALAQGHHLARRLHGHDRLPHQPRHRRHDLVRAPPHARPGGDRRDRGPRLPGRVQVDGPAHPGPPRHQQGDERDVDLRPPHHPGRGVRPLPRPHGRPPQGRGRLLRPRLLGPRRPAPAGEVGDGREPRALRDAGRARGGREADEGAAAHPQLPGARPPGGGPRPPRPRPGSAPRPRPRDLRPHPVGPRPRVHDRRALRRGRGDAARDPRHPARDLLRDDRRRVHVHRRPRAEGLAPEPDGVVAQLPGPRRGEQEARPREDRGGGELRALPPHQVRRPQALLARGRGGAHPAPRPRPERRGSPRPARGRDRHVAPGAAQRPRHHGGEASLPDLRGVRGQRPELVPGLGGREVPPRRDRHPPRRHRGDDHGHAWPRTRATSSS